MSIGGMSSSAMRRWISRSAPKKTASGTNPLQSMIDKAKARTGANTGGAILEEEQDPLMMERASFFSSLFKGVGARRSLFSTLGNERGVFQAPSESRNVAEGENVVKKRRGSIFGNLGDSIFGN